MLTLFRAKRSMQWLITVWLLIGMSVTFCQSCLAHAANLDLTDTVPDKTHCKPDPDSVPDNSQRDPQQPDCDCDCDNLNANSITHIQPVTGTKPPSLPDLTLAAVNTFSPYRRYTAYTVPIIDPPERSTIPPLERSCVQLK